MSASLKDFDSLEQRAARNFRDALRDTNIKQVIYLSGIVNEKALSKHLRSRKAVEEILSEGPYHLTTLRAGIIIGSGSASFEIMRDLVEKLPVMVAPKWLNTRSQPIAIRNVIQFLTGVLMKKDTFDRSFDIGGPEVLTYKEMLLRFATVRKLRRWIFVVPVMTPRLSSYWLYFVTSISYKLAVNLVNSMKVEIICKDNDLQKMLYLRPLKYDDALRAAFTRIEKQNIVSSWTDALSSKVLNSGIEPVISVPVHGCVKDHRSIEVNSEERSLERVLSIGGDNGWYYANWLWAIRGFLDKLAGGVGLRRGRKDPHRIHAGESLDFWRVLYVSEKDKRLLLYAEMKLPGEAWLEFQIQDGLLHQRATFRPKGLWGRIYWVLLLPFHYFIFGGMARRIASL
jgi:uncharacterized protein YbjT (DUF2867 family)